MVHTAQAKAVLVCLLAGILAWAGCAAVPLQPPAQRPQWQQRLERVEREGERLAGHGGAAPDREDPAEEASLAARRELAETVGNYVQEVLTEFFADRLDQPVRDRPLRRQLVADVATAAAASVLRETTDADTWQADDGTVHAIVSVPAEQVHDHAIARLRSMLASQNPFSGDAEQIGSEAAAYLRTVSRRQRLRAVLAAPPPEGAAPPAWLERARHPEYPADQFFLVVGMGPDPEAAGEDARTLLLARLNGMLGELREELRASAGEDALSRNVRFVRSAEVRFASSELATVRRVDHWRDPVSGTVYVLSALNRETAALVLEGQLAESADHAAQLLAGARNQARAGNCREALDDDVAALEAAQRALCLQMKGLVLASADAGNQFREALPEPLVEEARLHLEEVLGRVNVTVLSGDGQWLAPGRPPAQPFVALVTAGPVATPLPAVPVRLRVQSTGAELGQTSTDQDGLATWQLARAPAGVGADGVLLAQLDLAALAPGVDLSGLPVPAASFEFVLRSGADTSFVVMARGDVSGEFEPALEDVLQHHGLRPVEPELLLRHLKALGPIEEPLDTEVLGVFSELRDALGAGKFLLVVWGGAETEIMDRVHTDQGELCIARCAFEFRLLDPDLPGADKRLATVSGAGQGASLGGPEEAGSRATTDALSAARDQLRYSLSARFGAPPPG